MFYIYFSLYISETYNLWRNKVCAYDGGTTALLHPMAIFVSRQGWLWTFRTHVFRHLLAAWQCSGVAGWCDMLWDMLLDMLWDILLSYSSGKIVWKKLIYVDVSANWGIIPPEVAILEMVPMMISQRMDASWEKTAMGKWAATCKWKRWNIQQWEPQEKAAVWFRSFSVEPC